MKTLTRLFFCCSILLALPALADIHSKLITIKEGGVITDDAGAFHCVQVIQNISERPLWITLRQGEGASACEVTAKIEPWKTADFKCDLTELKPGTVPVAIDIFADEARTQNLEPVRDAMHFSRSDIRTLKDLAEAQRLPASYDGIYYAEKLGAREIFRQLIPHADGKLKISAAAIEYVDAKRAVTIPSSKVRDVSLADAGGASPYIVVTYQEADGLKRVGFQALSTPNDTRKIVFSLETAARASVKDKVEPMPGETLGEPMLQRDTAASILAFEKALAPDCAAPKIVDTKVVEKLSGVEVKEGRPVKGHWAERWVVDRCGTQVSYGVSYEADPKGGTNIGITKP